MTNANPEQIVVDERDEAIITLTLNRPDKSNALHPDLVNQLSTALKEIEADASLSAVIITGAGRSFCAGLDLSLLISWTMEEKLAYLETVTTMFRQVWTLPQPISEDHQKRVAEVYASLKKRG